MNLCYSRLYHRLQVHSPCRIPRTGPAILVSNHTSALDPLLIQSVCPRLIVWMVAREYCELPALKWLFGLIEAIPVERAGRDVAATRAALRVLHGGRVLGVFPEGRIETSRQLLPFQTGVALMSIRTQVPVYPVFIDGTQRNGSMKASLLCPQVASLSFGKAIRLNDEFSINDLNRATLFLQSTVELLGKEPHGMPNAASRTQKAVKSPVAM